MSQTASHVGVQRVIPALEQLEGEGMHVHRTIGSQRLPVLDPFLLLDQMGPSQFGPGDVQWMTAGDGVVHSELPAPELREKGGSMHGLQLWVNLPAKDKRMPPRYQDIMDDKIPEVQLEQQHGKIRVIAGRFKDQEAVIDTRTPITYLHAVLNAGGKVQLPVPEGHNSFVFVIKGKGSVAGEPVETSQLALLEETGGEVEVQAADEELSAILVTGKPLNEPVARYGPFVMNTQEQIIEAMRDFQAGRMGEIPAKFV